MLRFVHSISPSPRPCWYVAQPGAMQYQQANANVRPPNVALQLSLVLRFASPTTDLGATLENALKNHAHQCPSHKTSPKNIYNFPAHRTARLSQGCYERIQAFA